jgi:NDP-sugar pyrophosphorylase family protein
MKAALIAAGHGERLQEAGIRVPKPLVQIAGRPLIDYVLASVAATGITEMACIFNEQFDAVEEHCRQNAHGLRLDIVRRTTPSSMESLFTLAPFLLDERFLLLTVDAIFGPQVLPDFLAAACQREDADGVLAVNDFIDDEKPLRVVLDGKGWITAIGAAANGSPIITAGFYVFQPSIFAEIEAARRARFTALRQFLGHLLAQGYRLSGAMVPKTIDVDRPVDVATAEAFVRGGFA